MRLPSARTLLQTLGLHVSVMGQQALPALALLLAVAGVVAGPRLTLPQAAQALGVVGTALLTLLAAGIEAPVAEGGPKLQYAVLSGTALLTVASRLWLHNPERGRGAT